MKKKTWYIIGGVLLFLIVTNPSMSAFKDFTGDHTNQARSFVKANFIICKLFRHSGNLYLGIAGNFILISK